MAHRTCSLIVFALTLIGWFVDRADAQVEGGIDWRKGMVTVVGLGAPKEGVSSAQARILAQRAAKVTAYRDLVEFLKGLQISSETTVQDAMVASDKIQARVQGVIRGAKQVGPAQYDPDGVARVTVAVRLPGNLADALLPQEGFSASPPPVAPNAQTPDSAMPAENVTGLIVDARGLGLMSAMVPKLLDQNGQVVYGPALVNRKAAVQNGGLAGYEKDPDAARKNDRVGSNPLVIKGIEAQGTYKANVIISNADAENVRRAAEGHTFLNQCRVVIVVD